MTTIVRPLHNRILIKRHEAESESRGGIYIPDTARDRPLKATVMAVGERRSPKGALLPPVVQAGDQVLVGRFAGIEVRINGELLALVDESEVVGRFEVLQHCPTTFSDMADVERFGWPSVPRG